MCLLNLDMFIEFRSIGVLEMFQNTLQMLENRENTNFLLFTGSTCSENIYFQMLKLAVSVRIEDSRLLLLFWVE